MDIDKFQKLIEETYLKKEFADVLAWLFSLASLSGINMEETISKYTAGCPVCHGIPCICIEK